MFCLASRRASPSNGRLDHHGEAQFRDRKLELSWQMVVVIHHLRKYRPDISLPRQRKSFGHATMIHLQSSCPRIGLVRFLPPGSKSCGNANGSSVVSFALPSLDQERDKLFVYYCGYSTTAGCSVPIMLCVTAPGSLYGGAVSESRKGGRRGFIIGRRHEGDD